MNVADFDAWRERYDEMTYQEMKDFYNRVEMEHPLQQAYNAEAFGRFLDHVLERDFPITVLEIGGWKGELAQIMLDKSDYDPPIFAIEKWYNYEICRNAIEKSVLSDQRYKPVIPDNFVWNIDLPKADVLIASHFVEHIKWWELVALIHNLPETIRFIGLQAPLGELEMDWAG